MVLLGIVLIGLAVLLVGGVAGLLVYAGVVLVVLGTAMAIVRGRK
jgi:hypothetical protein